MDTTVLDATNYRYVVMRLDLYDVLLFNCGRGLLSVYSERDLAKAYSSPITGTHPSFLTIIFSYFVSVTVNITVLLLVVPLHNSHMFDTIPSFFSTVYLSTKPFSDIARNNKISFVLQPPPPVNDTNPFNVFRPREKIHRPHTRRVTILFILCVSDVIRSL